VYVATQRQQVNPARFLSATLDQYTLFLRLLAAEITRSSPSTDPATYITPILRRILPSLRLYSKWLIFHHQELSESTDFWNQYILTSTSLQTIWQDSSPPKLSYPLEEDFAAAGFAPLEPLDTPESTKRKHKRDRARIGNRKRGFDKLLLQWGRNGGDSPSNNRPDHPNVEMVLRLADLLLDALELAQVPVRLTVFELA